MPLQDLNPTIDDFAASSWEAVIQARNGTSDDLYSPFVIEARRAAEEGNSSSEAVFSVLAAVSSFHINLEKREQPFGPMMVMGGSRSPIPEDLSPNHLAVLEQILPTVTSDDFRARIADVLWVQVRPRKFQIAVTAISAYLASFHQLVNLEPVQAIERLERAFQLAAFLGKNNENFATVSRTAEETLRNLGPESHPFLPQSLLELLEKFGVGDAAALAQIADARARASETGNDWQTARSFWELKLKFDRKRGDDEAQLASLEAIANTFAQEAETLISGPGSNYLQAGEILQQGVEAYRRVPGRGEEERRLHLKLLEVQRRSKEELHTFSKEIDLSEIAERSKSHMNRKSMRDALLLLPLIATLPGYERLRLSVTEKIQRHPLLFLFSALQLDEEGRVSSRRPSMLSDDPGDREAIILAEVFKDMRLHRELSVTGQIEPARKQILFDHNPRLEDILDLVQYSPFVPEGRIWLFGRGLYDGLMGDFLSASHILIPQIENSVRYVLHKAGAVTSSLTSEGTQESFNLNKLLYLPAAKQLFGLDAIYDMRGLLVEKVGSNLRNDMAHGLLSDGNFFASDVVYLWWITLRMCLLPIVLHEHEASAEAQSDSSQEESPAEASEASDTPSIEE